MAQFSRAVWLFLKNEIPEVSSRSETKTESIAVEKMYRRHRGTICIGKGMVS